MGVPGRVLVAGEETKESLSTWPRAAAAAQQSSSGAREGERRRRRRRREEQDAADGREGEDGLVGLRSTSDFAL